MSIRLAVMGFRHNHIFDRWRRVQDMLRIEVVGACEEDPTTRELIAAEGLVEITHVD